MQKEQKWLPHDIFACILEQLPDYPTLYNSIRSGRPLYNAFKANRTVITTRIAQGLFGDLLGETLELIRADFWRLGDKDVQRSVQHKDVAREHAGERGLRVTDIRGLQIVASVGQDLEELFILGDSGESFEKMQLTTEESQRFQRGLCRFWACAMLFQKAPISIASGQSRWDHMWLTLASKWPSVEYLEVHAIGTVLKTALIRKCIVSKVYDEYTVDWRVNGILLEGPEFVRDLLQVAALRSFKSYMANAPAITSYFIENWLISPLEAREVKALICHEGLPTDVIREEGHLKLLELQREILKDL